MKNTSKIFKVTLDGNFTQVPNSLLQSTELTCEEIYLISNLCSRPEGWVFVRKNYWKQCQLGRDRFFKAWLGLQEKGYIKKKVRMEGNLIAGYDYSISYLPIFSSTEIQNSQDSEQLKSRTHIKTDLINKDLKKKEDKNKIPIANSLVAEKYEDIIHFNKSLKKEDKVKLFDSMFSDL